MEKKYITVIRGIYVKVSGKGMGINMEKIQADFICLGVPKCGTTTLYHILEQHRDIVFSKGGKNPYYYCENEEEIQKFNDRCWGGGKIF